MSQKDAERLRGTGVHRELLEKRGATGKGWLYKCRLICAEWRAYFRHIGEMDAFKGQRQRYALKSTE